jgi:hypothetical protein
MRRTLLALVTIFCFCAVAQAQTSTPDSGNVKDGIYSNTFFGFSYTYPKDWVVHDEATKERMMELGKERARETKALSDASAEVLAKHTYQLLTVFQYQLGTPGVERNAAIQVAAEDVRHAPAIVNGRVYLLNVRQLLTKMGAQPLQAEPIEVVLAGHKFFRQDFESLVEGKPVHTSMLVNVTKGWTLAFIFTAADRPQVDEMIKTLETLKFSGPATITLN